MRPDAARACQCALEPLPEQFAVGHLGQLIVLSHVLQPGVQLLALDGDGDLCADVLQQFLVLLGVALVVRRTLDDQRANRAALRVQRHAQPTRRIWPRYKVVEPRRQVVATRRQQDWLAAANHFGAQTPGDRARQFRLPFPVVDVIGEVKLRTLFVIQRHRKIQRRQPLANNQVYALEQRQQVCRGMGRLGNRIQRRLPGLGLLAFGDVPGHGNAQLVHRRPARRPQDVHHPTVLAQVTVLEIELGLAVHDLPRRLKGPLTVGGVHQVDHRLADQLLRGVAKNLFAGSTDKHETPLAVDGTHGVQQKVDVAGQRRGNFECPWGWRSSG